MIEIYKTINGKLTQIDFPDPGSWVSVVEPTNEEKVWLSTELGIVPEFVRSALDDEESSHTDFDDDTSQALIIVDCAFIEDQFEAEDPNFTQYDTHPLSFLFIPERDLLVTVTLRHNVTVEHFAQGNVRSMKTNQRSRLLFQMLLNISQRYLVYLHAIQRQFNENEKTLRATMRNEELIRMLGLEKSLVYFSTSLKATEATINRVRSGRVVRLYEDDIDLLEDVLIELRQAAEMCAIESSILTGTMNTFGSVISNNLNVTMRSLTVIMMIIAIPTVVFSFYGMNVDGLPMIESVLAPCVASAVLCVIAALICVKGKFLK